MFVCGAARLLHPTENNCLKIDVLNDTLWFRPSPFKRFPFCTLLFPVAGHCFRSFGFYFSFLVCFCSLYLSLFLTCIALPWMRYHCLFDGLFHIILFDENSKKNTVLSIIYNNNKHWFRPFQKNWSCVCCCKWFRIGYGVAANRYY